VSVKCEEMMSLLPFRIPEFFFERFFAFERKKEGTLTLTRTKQREKKKRNFTTFSNNSFLRTNIIPTDYEVHTLTYPLRCNNLTNIVSNAQS